MTDETDDELGMAWWNTATDRERAHWLAVADSARPVDAWRAFQRGEPRQAQQPEDSGPSL